MGKRTQNTGGFPMDGMAEAIESSMAVSFSDCETEEILAAIEEYHGIFAPLFARREQRDWAEFYLRGLVSPDIERKSIEPMVLAIKGVDGNAVRTAQQFISIGAWDDEAILGRHWEEVDVTLGEEDGVFILDGSDFAKQGKESVGVKRQYCGELGKRANCQAGVFLGYASSKGYTLLDRRLYLPQEWISSPLYAERRRKCAIPRDIGFQSKNELSWEMIEAVHRQGIMRGRWVACDEAFGRDTVLLDRIAGIGLWYFAEVPKDTRVWLRRPVTEIPVWKGHGRKPRRLMVLQGEASPRTVSEVAASLPPSTLDTAFD
jgi:SRSO17 transposase